LRTAAIGFAAAFLLAAGAHGQLQVRLDAGLLTLEADTVPLAEIVEEISRQAGFATTLIGDFTAPVSVTLDKVTVAAALERLLADTDRIVIYADSPADAAGRRIVRLWLFEPGDDRQAAAAPPPTAPDPLQHDDARIRSRAVLRLTQSGARQDVLDTLGQILQEDDDPLVRSRAALALGSLHDPRALATLEAALSDASFTVRAQSVQALGQIGGEQATGILGNVLLHDPDSLLRTIAAQNLHKEDSPSAQSFLDAAVDDPDQQVRAAAARPPSSPLATDLPAAGADRQ
jgi:HEAT repeat protein